MAYQENDIVRAARDLSNILYSARANGLPLPFAGGAYNYTQTLNLTFMNRDEVRAWVTALGIDEVSESDGIITTEFEWLHVRLRLSAV